MDRLNRILFWVVLFNMTLSLTLVICGGVVRFSRRMDYVECDIEIQLKSEDFDMSNIPTDYNEIRRDIENIVGIHVYFYSEKRLANDMGISNPIIRYVIISDDLNYIEYIETICHELCHLKYYTCNERFTQFKTFEHLYNSKYRPIAYKILYDMYRGRYWEDYDCYYQIVEYLRSENE